MRNEPSRPCRGLLIAASMFLLLTTASTAYGQSSRSAGIEGVVVKNTSRQISPGLYECVIYLEGSKALLDSIEDVRYTLPSGYSNRKQKIKTMYAKDKQYAFASKPITTTEEVIVNVKIDSEGRKDAYLSYKLRLFNDTP